MAAVGVRLSDVVRPFTGEGDVVVRIQKVDLVAKLTKVQDVASFLPLYLEGNALAVYLEMSDEDKGKLEKIKSRLIEAIFGNRFIAFAKLKSIRWSGEPVDVFANTLRRLGRESGLADEGLVIVTGLPDHVSLELQQVQGIEKMNISDIIGKAWVLTANPGSKEPMGQKMAAAVTSKTKRPVAVSCFRCGGEHFIKDCPEPAKGVDCWGCGKTGHIVKWCPDKRDEQKKGHKKERDSRNSCSAGVGASKSETSGGEGARNRGNLHRVPMIEAVVDGRLCQAMVDTGCTMSLVNSKLVRKWSGESTMVAFDGHAVQCRGVADVVWGVGGSTVRTRATVVDKIVGDVDAVIGTDVIQRLGGVMVCGDKIQFGNLNCSVRCRFHDASPNVKEHLVDKDFEAWVNGRCWTVRYFWKQGEPPLLKNKVAQYDTKLSEEKKEAFDMEVERWIKEGILVPWEGEVGGVIPLMATEQETKNKVRPVLDFRDLNEFVACHTGGDLLDVCADRMREWRQIEGETESVDPASGKHDPGEQSVRKSWSRLAIDVTYYRGLPYLTMVDCGPGRFAIWRELRSETAQTICREVNQVFLERGAVEEVLMDNATAFRSGEMMELLNKWGIQPFFRAAYRPNGNGIIERNHRTVKVLAERSGVTPMEAVFWYNMSPRNGQEESSVPHRSVFRYEWRNPMIGKQVETSPLDFLQIGEEVWVKPANVPHIGEEER